MTTAEIDNLEHKNWKMESFFNLAECNYFTNNIAFFFLLEWVMSRSFNWQKKKTDIVCMYVTKNYLHETT